MQLGKYSNRPAAQVLGKHLRGWPQTLVLARRERPQVGHFAISGRTDLPLCPSEACEPAATAAQLAGLAAHVSLHQVSSIDNPPEDWARGCYLDLHKHPRADDDLLYGTDSSFSEALAYILVGFIGAAAWPTDSDMHVIYMHAIYAFKMSHQ